MMTGVMMCRADACLVTVVHGDVGVMFQRIGDAWWRRDYALLCRTTPLPCRAPPLPYYAAFL
jgi:hypothetical protein